MTSLTASSSRPSWPDGRLESNLGAVSTPDQRFLIGPGRPRGVQKRRHYYNSHALNIIASMNALITSWGAPPAATSASLLPSDGFVEGDDIVSSSGYLDASPPIACMIGRRLTS